MISETKEVNSGMPQGKFLKRQQVLKASGSTYLPSDFVVGTELNILGKQFRITDCDQYTREFFEFQKNPQPAAIPIPVDSYSESIVKKPKTSDASELKEFMEKSLGGGRVVPQKQFLDNDRKVLRFYTT